MESKNHQRGGDSFHYQISRSNLFALPNKQGFFMLICKTMQRHDILLLPKRIKVRYDMGNDRNTRYVWGFHSWRYCWSLLREGGF